MHNFAVEQTVGSHALAHGCSLRRWADARGPRRARGRPIGAAALARRVRGLLAQPITRLEPTAAPASSLACAPVAQPPLR